MTLRIVGGQFKGRSLKTPKGSGTRPTQAMLREAVFNICQSEIADARFLDLFAGSGAMGLEALSRGAAHVTLIERNRSAVASIRENIAALQVASQVTLVACDAKMGIERLETPFDILYLDPPYDVPSTPFVELLLAKGLIAKEGTLFIEERSHSGPPPQFQSLHLVSSRRFGDALLHQYRFSATKNS